MPEHYKHLTRAAETEQLAFTLDRNRGVTVDWAVTMLFYAALHYIDSFLAGKNLHPLDHTRRDSEIEKNGTLTEIFKDYRRLKDLSREARYMIPDFPPEKLDLAIMRLETIKRHLGFQ